MQIREKLRQIVIVRESPHRIAIAFALGVFIGMSPFLGVHTILGLALAWVFKLNRFVTLIGVYITNPWTIVPIYTFGTWMGTKLMGIDRIIPDIDWAHISIVSFFENFKPLIMPFLAGNMLLGLISGVISYFLIYMAVQKNRG